MTDFQYLDGPYNVIAGGAYDQYFAHESGSKRCFILGAKWQREQIEMKQAALERLAPTIPVPRDVLRQVREVMEDARDTLACSYEAQDVNSDEISGLNNALALLRGLPVARAGGEHMTTPAAEALYRAQHNHAMEGKGYAVFNPHNKPLDELPFIYGMNNGGKPGWFSAVAVSEDGVVLGGHTCSHEDYMPADLGILEGTRPDRHENSYQKHYPDGYRMTFVPRNEVSSHAGIQNAFKLNQERAAQKRGLEGQG